MGAIYFSKSFRFKSNKLYLNKYKQIQSSFDWIFNVPVSKLEYTKQFIPWKQFQNLRYIRGWNHWHHDPQYPTAIDKIPKFKIGKNENQLENGVDWYKHKGYKAYSYSLSFTFMFIIL